LVAYVAACCGALFVLKFFNPVQWLRLFSTDYSIGFIFVAGGLLAIFAKKVRPQNLLLALAAAAYVIALTYQQVGYVCPTRLEQGLNPPRARKFSSGIRGVRPVLNPHRAGKVDITRSYATGVAR